MYNARNYKLCTSIPAFPHYSPKPQYCFLCVFISLSPSEYWALVINNHQNGLLRSVALSATPNMPEPQILSARRQCLFLSYSVSFAVLHRNPGLAQNVVKQRNKRKKKKNTCAYCWGCTPTKLRCSRVCVLWRSIGLKSPTSEWKACEKSACLFKRCELRELLISRSFDNESLEQKLYKKRDYLFEENASFKHCWQCLSSRWIS